MPRRSCVGCGRIAPKHELVRIAARTGEGPRAAVAVIDERAAMPGRGAYLCRAGGAPLPAAACLARALRRNAIQRTLRAAVTLDPKIVESVSP